MAVFLVNDLVRVTVPGMFQDALATIVQQGTGVYTDMYEVRTVRRGTIVWVHVDHIRHAPQEDRQR